MAVVTAFLHTCGVVVFPYIDDWLLMALLQESLRGSILLTLTLLKDSPLLITPYPLPDSEVHRVVYQYFNLQGFSASRRGVDTLPDGCKSMISWQGPSLINRDCYPICFSTNVTFQLWFMRTFRPHRKSQRTILSIPPRAPPLVVGMRTPPATGFLLSPSRLSAHNDSLLGRGTHLLHYSIGAPWRPPSRFPLHSSLLLPCPVGQSSENHVRQ